VLIATIAGPTRVEAGRTVRNVAYVYAGVEMSQDRLTFPVQARDTRGHWKAAGGIAVGEIPASFGWLSYADDRVARWDATPLTLRIECPMEWLACPVTGGGRSCQQCERVSPYLLEFGTEILRSYLDRSLPAATCDDPCPPPDSPDIARLRRLDQRVDLWRPRRTPLARVSSLYRSLDDCLRDHPPRAAGAGKK
jgi:hypothetical protein